MEFFGEISIYLIITLSKLGKNISHLQPLTELVEEDFRSVNQNKQYLFDKAEMSQSLFEIRRVYQDENRR